MIKHYGYTAPETIAWCRICRPGSIVGPQQQFMMSIETKLRQEGDAYRDKHEKHRMLSQAPKQSPSNNVYKLAIGTAFTVQGADHQMQAIQQQVRMRRVVTQQNICNALIGF